MAMSKYGNRKTEVDGILFDSKKEAERWPKYSELYLKAFERMLEERERRGLPTEWKTAEEVMVWWMQIKAD